MTRATLLPLSRLIAFGPSCRSPRSLPALAVVVRAGDGDPGNSVASRHSSLMSALGQKRHVLFLALL